MQCSIYSMKITHIVIVCFQNLVIGVVCTLLITEMNVVQGNAGFVDISENQRYQSVSTNTFLFSF
jgi:hypothetical protein